MGKKDDDAKVRVLEKVKDESTVPNSDKTQKKQADAEDEKKKDDDAKRSLKVDLEGLNPEDLRYAQIERELEHDYAKFPVRQLKAAKKNEKAEKQAEESKGNNIEDDEETKNEESTKEKEKEEQE